MRWAKRNPMSFTVLVVIVVALVYIGTQVHSANTNASKATSAVADLSDVLNRRSPILEYLSCSDQRDVAVDHAEKAFLLAIVDRAPNSTDLRADYERAVAVRDKTRLPVDQGGCGGIPGGG